METIYHQCFQLRFIYTINTVHENKSKLEMNRTHQFLVCAHDVNLLGQNINIIQKNTEALLDASKEAGVGVNAEEARDMFVHHLTTKSSYCKGSS
jgi:hypothetical protein